MRRPSAHSVRAPVCEPWCIERCVDLNGAILSECGGCSSERYACRRGMPGFPATTSQEGHIHLARASELPTLDWGGRKPRVAVCITGGVRSLPQIVAAFRRNVVDALDAETDLFYVIDLESAPRRNLSDASLHANRKRTLARIMANEGAYSHSIASFANVTQALPRPKAAVLRQQGGHADEEPYCVLQFEKLWECMAEIRRVERRQHRRYDFVIRQRTDVLPKAPWPPATSLKRAAYFLSYSACTMGGDCSAHDHRKQRAANCADLPWADELVCWQQFRRNPSVRDRDGLTHRDYLVGAFGMLRLHERFANDGEAFNTGYFSGKHSRCLQGVALNACEEWMWCSLQEQNATLVSAMPWMSGDIVRLSREGVDHENGMVLAHRSR